MTEEGAARLGPYALESMIGGGGMGEVWRARDTEHDDRLVALKLLPSGLALDPAFRTRFRRESRLAAALRSPHVVPIHRYGEVDGRLYLDMELVGGRDLSTVLTEDGPLPPARVASIVEQLAGVLDLAHGDGLVHRDLKPSNVRVLDDDFVYLFDFGIATRPDLTATGGSRIAGTPDYMAPEQFESGPVDHRADVYSLACLFYTCLTGRPPFAAGSLPEALRAHLDQPPPRPAAEHPFLPPEFDTVVATGMAKRPENRYATAGALAAAVRAALAGTTPAAAPTVGGPVGGAGIAAPATGVAGPQLTRGDGLGGGVGDLSTKDSSFARGGGLGRLRVAAVVAVVLILGGGITAAAVAGRSRQLAGTAVPVAAGPSAGTPAAGSPVAQPKPAILPPLPAGTVSSVPVGQAPFGLAVAPDGRRVCVADEGGGTVSVVDVATSARVTTITVSGNPSGVAFTPSGDAMWVAVPQGLQEIDPATATVRRTVPLQARAYSMAISADGRFGYTALQRDGLVVEVDLRAGVVTRRYPVASPDFVALSPDGTTLAVTSFDNPDLVLLDRADGQVTATVPVGGPAFSPTYSPDGRHLYVAEADRPQVDLVDVASRAVTGSVRFDKPAVNVAFSPDGRTAYAHGEGNVLTIIDVATGTSRGTLPVTADNSASVALAPDGSRAYVVDQDRGVLLVAALPPGK
ncbi:protein kinase [Amycolatopsis sp. NBC_00345]|uniref:protein kinase domain-containing protein n=1 Tax=Amycolatopsis sp. NBC_00345 TaxID=2975955 RepID=UPI002E25613E